MKDRDTSAPDPAAQRRRTRIVITIVVAVIVPMAAFIIQNTAPTPKSYYPRCAFKTLTGLNCPGCGTARSLHALFNGRFAEATASNPLLIVVLPPLIVAIGLELHAAWTGHRIWRRRLPARGILAFFWIVLAYWVARNIDVYPLSMLAPPDIHDLESLTES